MTGECEHPQNTVRLHGPERLSGLDASFLYNETPTEHMHTLKLAVLEGPDEPLPFEAVREVIGERMWRLPAFNRRLAEVPADLHHPVWVPAGDPDLRYHVRLARVPAPGDDRAMDTLVGRLAGWPLDRTHPLWQVWILEGRSDGRMGVLVKLHHCVADGVAANALLAALMSEPPDTEMPEGPPEPPRRRELLVDATRDLVRDLQVLPSVLKRVRRAVRRRGEAVDQLSREGGEAPPRPILDTPATSFNRAITAARAVATTNLDLAPVLAAKARYDVSVNDVFLTLVGGALSEVLATSEEHPSRSLIASVPVSAEPGRTGNTEPGRTGNTEPGRTGNTEPGRTGNTEPGRTGNTEPGRTSRTEPRRTGNKVSNLFVSLHTEIADPAVRLVAVHASMDAAKRLHDALGADVMETLLGYTPPKPYRWIMAAYSGLDLADRHRAPVNVICSTVPGPKEELSVAGARLVEFYSAGPVLEGIGVNITAWSYVDRMDVMVIACARALPDPHRLTEALHRQLALLGAEAQPNNH